MEIENPVAGPGGMKAQPLRNHDQESGGEAGAEASTACGLERGLLPQGTGGASWSELLVAKVRIEKERGHLLGGAEKGRGLSGVKPM